MEHARTKHHQFVDSEIVIVINTTTGELMRFGKRNEAAGKFEDALESVVEGHHGCGFETSLAIVRVPAVLGYAL